MSKKYVQISLMIAVSSILFTVENFIPMPSPWFRLGLANIMTLLALHWWGLLEAGFIIIVRVFIGALLSGKLFTPLFVLSISGNITAVFAMYFAFKFQKKIFSLIGISILGALIKNFTQIIIVNYLYIQHIYIFNLIPFFLVASLVSGFIVGFLADIIQKRLSKFAKFT